MKKFLCCLPLELCIAATYWVNILQIVWCIVCILNEDISCSLLAHGTLMQDHNDIIAFSIAVIFMTLLKLVLLLLISKSVPLTARRFRFLFFLMLLFFAAFFCVYLVVGVTIAADGSWHALAVFVGYAAIALYLLLCYYQLKKLHDSSESDREKQQALCKAKRHLVIDSNSPSVRGRTLAQRSDCNMLPIDFQEHAAESLGDVQRH